MGSTSRGLIDEVRIWNVARTASQIESDMNTPIGQAPPVDSSPPSVPGEFGRNAVCREGGVELERVD